MEKRKNRMLHKAFVAEGPKLVGELLPYFPPLYVAATKEWLTLNNHLLNDVGEVDEVSHEELERLSLLQNPQSVLAVMPMRESPLDFELPTTTSQLFLALDGVQDPGNMGTILRVADWFGIRHVLCSLATDPNGTDGTVDVYNPKCVQSCMGAMARVDVHYCNLPELLSTVQMPIYGTFLNGKVIYEEELTPNGIIVMGNEGNGISNKVAKLVDKRLYVPNFPQGSHSTESLNVAIATGIVCSEFRRRSYLEYFL